MPSDIFEPRGVPSPSRFHQDIPIAPEKPNQRPGAAGDRRSNPPPPSSSVIPNGRTASNDSHWESTLFSSSLSDLSSRKLRLPKSDHLASFMSVNREEEEPFESLEEMEARTIGNLLPDEDDFFAGVVGEVGHKPRPNDLDNDFDLFSSVGGMELDGDVFSNQSRRDGERLGSNVSVSGELPKGGEVLSSRTLFVRNMDSIIEDCDLRVLFEQYGDVRALNTAGKSRGFIMVSYYDIRAAQNAMSALHGRLLRGRKLDIHYPIPKENALKENTSEGALLVNNLDSSVSSEEFHRIVNSFGEIREVRHEKSQIYIEFFDVRAAEAALRGLNGIEIAGRQLKLAPSCPQGTSFTSQFTTDDVERGLSKMAFTNLSSTEHIGRHFPGILASTSIDCGSMQVMHNGFAPSTRIISACKAVDLQESGNPFDSSKMGIQSMPNLHPHSFHEYFASGGSPYKSSTAFSEMVSDSQKASEGFIMNSGYANPILWSNSNTQQHNPSSGMMSLSRGNSIPLQRIPPVTAFSRVSPPLMVNMSSSPVHHHVGSAPVLNSPFLARRQAYVVAESQKVFGGNRMDTNSKNAVLRSSPQMSTHLYNGRSPRLLVPGSFGLPNERYRNLSNRRSDSSSSTAEKKLYELDVDRILRGEDSRTTLMIKNIPNKYTSKMLLVAIDEYCKGTYDFFYLPIDFKNKCNVGYAFINLTKPENIVPLYKAFNGKKWEKFNSEKVASLAYGRIQGQSALITHFQNSSLMNEDKRCRPILFHTTGPNAGEQEPFPMGSNIRSRPGRHRTSRIDNYTNFSSSYENREERDMF